MPRGKNYVNQNRGMTLEAAGKTKAVSTTEKKKKSTVVEMCFYGYGCTRKGCIYQHPTKKISEIPSDKSDTPCKPHLVGMCVFNTTTCNKRHVTDPTERGKLIEQFSKIPCRFGSQCKQQNTGSCLYLHPTATTTTTTAAESSSSTTNISQSQPPLTCIPIPQQGPPNYFGGVPPTAATAGMPFRPPPTAAFPGSSLRVALPTGIGGGVGAATINSTSVIEQQKKQQPLLSSARIQPPSLPQAIYPNVVGNPIQRTYQMIDNSNTGNSLLHNQQQQRIMPSYNNSNNANAAMSQPINQSQQYTMPYSRFPPSQQMMMQQQRQHQQPATLGVYDQNEFPPLGGGGGDGDTTSLGSGASNITSTRSNPISSIGTSTEGKPNASTTANQNFNINAKEFVPGRW